jgi:hypothetical protein
MLTLPFEFACGSRQLWGGRLPQLREAMTEEMKGRVVGGEG